MRRESRPELAVAQAMSSVHGRREDDAQRRRGVRAKPDRVIVRATTGGHRFLRLLCSDRTREERVHIAVVRAVDRSMSSSDVVVALHVFVVIAADTGGRSDTDVFLGAIEDERRDRCSVHPERRRDELRDFGEPRLLITRSIVGELDGADEVDGLQPYDHRRRAHARSSAHGSQSARSVIQMTMP
jgi:hypothetical protein